MEERNLQHDDVDIYVEPKKRMPLTVVIMASLLGALMFGYGLAGALVAIGTEMGGFEMIAWLFTASNIVQMVMNPLLPGISAKIPMPRLILIGLVVGLVSAVGFTLAPNMPVMIFFRALNGFSGAVLFNGGLAFAGQIMPPEKRPVVTSLQMVFNGIGSMAAPVLTGILVDAGSWRLWMAVTIVLYAAVLILYIPFYPRGVKPIPGAKIDGVGVALLAAIFLAVALLLQLSGTYWPWLSPITFILVAVTVAALVLFVRVELKMERSGRRPAFRVSLFKRNPFCIACLCAMCACIATNGIASYYSSYAQSVLGFSATQASLGYSIGSIGCILLSLTLSYFLGKKRMFKPCAVLTALVWIAVVVLVIALGTNMTPVLYIVLIAVFATMTGWGSSMNFVIGQTMVPTEDVLDSSAGVVSLQQVGAFLGVSLNAALINAVGYNGLFAMCAVGAALFLVFMLFLKDPAKQK